MSYRSKLNTLVRFGHVNSTATQCFLTCALFTITTLESWYSSLSHKILRSSVFERNANAFSLNASVDVCLRRRLRRSRRHEMIFFGKAPLGVLPYFHRVRQPASSSSLSLFITKWGSRISRERFDLESPKFTRTFIPVGSTTTPDMTSPCTSRRKLSTFANGPKMTPPTAWT